MAAIAQTTLIAASLAILIYIAVITTGNYLATQSSSHDNPLSQQSQIDNALHKQISTNLNYSVSGPLPTYNKSCTYCPYIF
jgi:hypothetical protein